jgi:cell division protein FtsL
MAKGRTPNIVSLEARAEKLVKSIAKHRQLAEEQTTELTDVRKRIEELNSPEYRQHLKELAEKKRAELEKVLAQIEKNEAAEAVS